MSANPSNAIAVGADSLRAWPRRLPRPEGVWYLLALLLVVGFAIKPSFLAVNNLNSIFVATVPLVLLAIGQTFVLVGREIDLSVGSTVGLSAVVCGSFMAGDPRLIFPVCILAIVLSCLIGLFNGVITVLIGVPSFVVTLGMLLIVRGIIYVWTGGAPNSNVPAELTFWLTGTKVLGFAAGALVIMAFVLVVAYLLAHRSHFGRRLFVTGAGPTAARLAGLPARRTTVLAFVVSGAFAGIAGVYYAAWTGSIRGDQGTGLELVAIAAAVLGGVSLAGGAGRVLSAAAGALSLGLILNLLIAAGLPLEAQYVGKGLIIILAVLVYKFRRSSAPRINPKAKSHLSRQTNAAALAVPSASKLNEE